MPETRQVFIGLSRPEIMAWYGLIVLSTATFAWGARASSRNTAVVVPSRWTIPGSVWSRWSRRSSHTGGSPDVTA